MTIKTAARTRRTAAAAVSAAAAPRRTRKTTAPAKPDEGLKVYTIHGLEEREIDVRIRRLDPLDKDGARELTEQIQRTSVRLWLLVTEAHDRKAHLALGYETWADYVKAELHMSESRSYQFLDTGHVMKALAAGGVDIETAPVPPTRVVARVKDRLTDVRKMAERVIREENGTAAQEIDKSLRALAREPRKPSKAAAAAASAATTAEPSVRATQDVEPEASVQCPACRGSGKVPKSRAGVIRDLMSKIKP